MRQWIKDRLFSARELIALPIMLVCLIFALFSWQNKEDL